MARYFFDLRDDDRGYSDPSGIELPNDEAAVDYARLIATDLMKNREQNTKHWSLNVMNDAGTKIGVVDFKTINPTVSARIYPFPRIAR
jgi:hypothetical protein